MGFGKNIKNLFVTRSFVRREIGIYVDQTKPRVEDNNLDMYAHESIPSLMEFSGIYLYLQKYYSKVFGKDYKSHYVSYYYATYGDFANLGDYIQTIATEEAIKKCVKGPVVFENVLRSALTDHQGGTCVMQGWYEHKQLTFLPGPDTRPVWVGTHFCTDARVMIKSLYESSNIRFNDIGCRDRSTLNFCKSLGMRAYFSRCLTLTLPRRSSEEEENAEEVYIVDCTNEIIENLPSNIKVGAQITTQRNFPFKNWMDWHQCREVAEQQLNEYRQNAKLVITTALHCAQPCIAMGIPVIFIHPEMEEADRFSAMDGIIKIYSLNDLKEGKVQFDVKAPDIQDLKAAILRNLELSMKENLSEKEENELSKVRLFIERYKIYD